MIGSTCSSRAFPPSLAPNVALAFALAFISASTILASNPSSAKEACHQVPSAFERVDPGDSESGIGGTGFAPKLHRLPLPGGDDESGIGGTGRAPLGGSGDESGIGGTGILGTVLRLDPLCVNGFQVQVPATLQIESATDGETLQTLSLGQIVFIRASRSDSSLIAQHIQIQPNLGGTPWENGPPLDLMSLEGIISDGPEGPRIGRFQLDFGSSELRPDARDLRPGTRVRVTGRPESGRILHITPPQRPPRPDARPTPPAPQRPEIPEPRPDWVRPERPQPRSIERPDILDRDIRRE